MADFVQDVDGGDHAGRADPRRRRAAADLAARATQMHHIGRQRARHFPEPVMKDSALNIMLSLFIGECEGFAVREASVLLANEEGPLAGADLVDRLVHAGLAVVTGETPGQRTVGLTPLGSAKMQGFLDDFRDVR